MATLPVDQGVRGFSHLISTASRKNRATPKIHPVETVRHFLQQGALVASTVSVWLNGRKSKAVGAGMAEKTEGQDTDAGSSGAGLEPDAATEEKEQMLDVRIPHVHAPHDENFSWRGFFTHVAVVAIGLLLALGLEQGVGYVHEGFQRARLETEMRQTFQSNLGRAEGNIRILNGFRTYLIDLRNAANSRIAGGSGHAPHASDPRNNAFAPPLSLGSYEASKINGSVALLGLNRVRLYDRIEFQQNLMISTFQNFVNSISEVQAFANRFDGTDERTFAKLPEPNIAELSAAELLEYRALLGKLIENCDGYARQNANLKASYRLMLDGVDDLDTLVDSVNKPMPNP